jgi:hypothetical protein
MNGVFMDKNTEKKPKMLSLEEIVRRQEVVLNGKMAKKPAVVGRRGPTIVPVIKNKGKGK